MTSTIPSFVRLAILLSVMVNGVVWPDGQYKGLILRPIDTISFNSTGMDVYLMEHDGLIYASKFTYDGNVVSILLLDEELEELKRDFPDWIGDDTFKEILFDVDENKITVSYLESEVTYYPI